MEQAQFPQRETAIAVLSDPQRVRRVPAGLELPADFVPESHLIRDCDPRSEEHTSELQSLMRISYAVFCLKKKTTSTNNKHNVRHQKRYKDRTAKQLKKYNT